MFGRAVSSLKSLAFSKTFTILHTFRFLPLDFAPIGQISSLCPASMRGRFANVTRRCGMRRDRRGCRSSLRVGRRGTSRTGWRTAAVGGRPKDPAMRRARIQSRRQPRCRWEWQAVNPARAERGRKAASVEVLGWSCHIAKDVDRPAMGASGARRSARPLKGFGEET
jgi:hypothetical protein